MCACAVVISRFFQQEHQDTSQHRTLVVKAPSCTEYLVSLLFVHATSAIAAGSAGRV